jgi:predicted TIM-barrel fold metal-dependent hydrolase
MRIDVHCHHHPDPWLAFVERRGGFAAIGLPPLRSWTLESHLAFMERWNITASVVSVVPPGVALGPVREAAAAARAVNAWGAELIAEHPTRFGVMATLPLHDPAAAAREADHALGDLGLDGVAVMTNEGGRHLGHPSWAPLLEVLDHHGATVLVHPTTLHPVPGAGYGDRPFPPAFVEWPFETARTAGDLIYSGAAGRHGSIRWILAHAGGVLPFLAFRLATLHAFSPDLGAVAPEGPMPHLARFYYETAQAFGPVQLDAVRAVAPPGHLLFGSDWPPVASLYEPKGIAAVPLPAEQMPRDGDPAPELGRLLGAAERAAVDAAPLALLPELAARLARGDMARSG